MWILAHLATVAAVVGFLVLGRWQLHRAVQGNLLSFGYALEWPAFAGFVVFVWFTQARQAVRAPTRAGDAAEASAAEAGATVRASRARTGPAYDDSGDAELAAYNRYLAWLNTHPDRPVSEYRAQPQEQL